MSKTKKCWMCKKEKYSILDEKVTIDRILDESKDYYVIVPRDPHLFGHILLVLKKHCKNLTVASTVELNTLSEPAARWSKILKKAFPDCRNVFLTCLCDNDDVHLHYHLFPVREKEKPQKGRGHKWLGANEGRIDIKPFCDCSEAEKKQEGNILEKWLIF